MKLCVIPARGGSKRIPKKNTKTFLGQPIIAYSIKAALSSGCFDRVVVSTDDNEIAQIANKYGAETPFRRPDELANDYTATLPVIQHAIEMIEIEGVKISEVCCLYATAPFVQSQAIQKAYQQMKATSSDYCFSVTRYAFPIQRSIKITEQQRVEMLYPEHLNARSQDLEETYHDAGQFYWGKVEAFKQLKPIFSEDSSPFILDNHLVQDIDTLEDWKRAEVMYQVLLKSGEV
jgi:N-acylneuraminate cytidylyltransferase